MIMAIFNLQLNMAFGWALVDLKPVCHYSKYDDMVTFKSPDDFTKNRDLGNFDLIGMTTYKGELVLRDQPVRGPINLDKPNDPPYEIFYREKITEFTFKPYSEHITYEFTPEPQSNMTPGPRGA